MREEQEYGQRSNFVNLSLMICLLFPHFFSFSGECSLGGAQRTQRFIPKIEGEMVTQRTQMWPSSYHFDKKAINTVYNLSVCLMKPEESLSTFNAFFLILIHTHTHTKIQKERRQVCCLQVSDLPHAARKRASAAASRAARVPAALRSAAAA